MAITASRLRLIHGRGYHSESEEKAAALYQSRCNLRIRCDEMGSEFGIVPEEQQRITIWTNTGGSTVHARAHQPLHPKPMRRDVLAEQYSPFDASIIV